MAKKLKKSSAKRSVKKTKETAKKAGAAKKKKGSVKRTKPVRKTSSKLVWKTRKSKKPSTRRNASLKKLQYELEKERMLEERLARLHEKDEEKNPNGGELVVSESKFQLGPKQNAGEFQAHNLPLEYGRNRVILLIVDPKFVFVYWEVQNDKMHEAITAIGQNSKLTLRFKNIDTGHFWDVSIYERVGNWYLKLDHPEQNLIVEIGMKNDRGDFYSISRSNNMKLPRTGLAPKGPIKWMLVSPTGEKVITEIEEYTDADLELLKRILGPYFFDLMQKGKFHTIIGSSAEHIFTEIEEIRAPSISS